MRFRKQFIIISITISLLFTFSFYSYAATQWAACMPYQTTTSGSYIRVQLINCNLPDPSGGKNGWMTLSVTDTSTKRFLISAAISQGEAVSIEYDTNNKDTDGYIYIIAVLINNPN